MTDPESSTMYHLRHQIEKLQARKAEQLKERDALLQRIEKAEREAAELEGRSE